MKKKSKTRRVVIDGDRASDRRQDTRSGSVREYRMRKPNRAPRPARV
jgi:hypothetical protein